MMTLRKQTSTADDQYSSNANYRLHLKLAAKGIHGTNDGPIFIPIYPDWHDREKKVATFLDGHEVHKNSKDYDEAVRLVLERAHWKVKREPYKGQISEERLDEVVDFIEVSLAETA